MDNVETLLNEDLIILGTNVRDSNECIKLMGNLFEEHGYVKEGYSDAVLAREAEYPTGLPGKSINIAIPHTNSELVNKSAIGILVPREAISFNMMGVKDKEVKCKLIIPLVIKDSKRQLNVLKKVVKMIENAELLEKLCIAESKQEVLHLLRDLEL
jgi:PTS system galactitol-specific IIA component